MRADFGTFLYQTDVEFMTSFSAKLHQPTSRRKPGRAAADDDHVELHRLARLLGHDSSVALSERSESSIISTRSGASWLRWLGCLWTKNVKFALVPRNQEQTI